MAEARPPKAPGAFRTIGEVAQATGIPQHVLRYWETRFPQLRPVTRAGNRRYYRPEDVALVERIRALLDREGYTIRGVQRMLASGGDPAAASPASSMTPVPAPADAVRRVRDLLAEALAADR